MQPNLILWRFCSSKTFLNLQFGKNGGTATFALKMHASMLNLLAALVDHPVYWMAPSDTLQLSICCQRHLVKQGPLHKKELMRRKNGTLLEEESVFLFVQWRRGASSMLILTIYLVSLQLWLRKGSATWASILLDGIRSGGQRLRTRAFWFASFSRGNDIWHLLGSFFFHLGPHGEFDETDSECRYCTRVPIIAILAHCSSNGYDA